MRSFARARSRVGIAIVVCIVSSFANVTAHATATTADPQLTTTVDHSGTGATVATVKTASLRSGTPAANPRILLIGTGVRKDLFPSALHPSIVTSSSADAADAHGFGTLAASTILQLVPDATIISKAVRSADSNWTLADLSSLASVLDWARANRASYDVAMFAFPPTAALDPITYTIGYGDYGSFGRGMALVNEALLATSFPTDGPIAGIPADKALRDKMFARANVKQRIAVEQFSLQAVAWRRVLDSVDALSASGVAIVAPAGDYTMKAGGSMVPLVTQTVYGLSALPSVITVGAAYDDGGTWRLSPTSGRGPTLTLGLKPDLLAPSNVMAMLPDGARLNWPDDSGRAPLNMIEWARSSVPPSPCPPLVGAEYNCVLQGSTAVSAAVVAANLGGLVATGTPHPASARAAGDDEILRGIAWAQASGTGALNGSRRAYAWEQGAGVLTGVRAFDRSQPVALARPSLGEVSFTRDATKTVPVWSGAGDIASARATLDEFIGPDASGQAVAAPWSDPGRITTTSSATGVTLTAAGARRQGGMYAGDLTLTSPSGAETVLPVDVVQTVPIDVHVDYGYNEYQAGGREGERVEDAAVVLFAGLPTNVGLVGEAFKNFGSRAFGQYGGDPTASVIIRAAQTKSQFKNPALPDREHGRAQISDVAPGFYRFHVLTDHGVEARQARGKVESLGIRLASSGPDGLATGQNLLVSSCEGTVTGPLPCAQRSGGNVDPSSGLCPVSNRATQVSFNVYCGEIGYAVPSAVVSRAVHLIEHDTDPTRSEWDACGIDIPTDGKSIDLATITGRASSCTGTTTPTAWTYTAGAPSCLPPAEASARGNERDVTASYMAAGSTSLPGRNLPVGVLSYDFTLPALNTYTTAGLSLSYVAENAIVAVRFQTGSGDASNGLIAIHGPNVDVTPAVQGAGARGTSYIEWSVMSANATGGRVSIVVIPTSWARADLDATKPVAKVQLCDAALRVSTFAKQPWGQADAMLRQQMSFADRGLAGQIDPSRSRMRAGFVNGGFTDAGVESESLHFAVQVPKNSTMNTAAPHHVRSPWGGPGSFAGAQGGNGSTSVLPPDWELNDPKYGVTSLACAENAANALHAAVCKAWNAARAANATLAELGPDLSINGRFAGVLAIDRAAIGRGGGTVLYRSSGLDDGGALDAAGRWASAPRFATSNFYDEAGTPALSLIDAILTITRTTSGLPVLSLRATDASSVTRLVTSRLA